jgi:cytochrome d ubiquinol oxidase subunit I
MVGLGMWSLLMRWRGKLYDAPFLHRAAVAMGPSGFVAVLAGWIVTEVGRQPFTIYGLLRTADSASPLDAPAVAASLVAFVITYFAVFGAGIWYLLRLMKKPPEAHERALDDTPTRAAGITPAPAVIEGEPA